MSIWPGVPGLGCPLPGGHLPPCPGHCPGPAARLVITTFFRPVDLVAVIPPAACPALAGALAGTGRRVLGVTVSCDSLPAGGVDPGQAAPYPAAHRALRPGGLLAVIAGRPAGGSIPDLGLAVVRAAGLIYSQHIILIHAAIDGD